jgi:hypothetical protein
MTCGVICYLLKANPQLKMLRKKRLRRNKNVNNGTEATAHTTYNQS